MVLCLRDRSLPLAPFCSKSPNHGDPVGQPEPCTLGARSGCPNCTLSTAIRTKPIRPDTGTIMSSGTNTYRHDVPVLIVGAGPVGLISSILLSRQNIPHILVEKRARISELPRARGLTVRSVEILSQLGLGDALQEIAQSDLWSTCFVYTETLSGELIGKMTGTLGARSDNEFSPARYIVAAQDRIDPLLHEAAVSYSQLDLQFNAEVIGFEQDDNGITATVRTADGASRQIRSLYIIAADGARSRLREMACIGMRGASDLAQFINNFVRADLSCFTQGREGALIWTLKPGATGVFQMLDEKERWAIQVQYDPKEIDVSKWTDDVATRYIRGMIGSNSADNVQ